jgi:hypothetical protein
MEVFVTVDTTRNVSYYEYYQSHGLYLSSYILKPREPVSLVILSDDE